MNIRRITQHIFRVLVCASLALSLNSTQASHTTGVYPATAWRQIAINGQINFTIDPSYPTFNGLGAQIRPAIRQAASAWNATRLTNDYYEYAIENANYHINFKDFGSTAGGATGFTWIPYRYDVSQNCITTATAGEFCNGQIQIGEFWSYAQTVGGVAHELGHGLGGLADHLNYDCATVMSSCWVDLTPPSSSDIVSMKTVYGIPHDLRLEKLNNIGLVRASLQNRSTYRYYFRFTLYKWNGSEAVFIHNIYVYATPAIGDTVSTEENLLMLAGPGQYTYQITVYQTFPNNLAAEILGGQTNWLDVLPAPYHTFIPAVMK